MSIRIQNLSKSYGKKVLFSDLTFHFGNQERFALVGANGAGKSTLLNILCNLDKADNGDIIRPGSYSIGYLPQEPSQNPKPSLLEECLTGSEKLYGLHTELNRLLDLMTTDYTEEVHAKYEKVEHQFQNLDGYQLEPKAKTILLGLGFQEAHFQKNPKEFSGGWRMRLELAKIFLNDPDFLILDEPTNHLDLPSLIWVENYLKEFQGTLLFVSHDKGLINRLATKILHLHHGRCDEYKGNFDDFLEQREARYIIEAKKNERLQKRMGEIQAFIDKFKAKASKAKQAQSRGKMLARMKSLESDMDFSKQEDEIHFQLSIGVPSGKDVLRMENVSIGYTEPLSKNIDLNIYKKQKIAVIGPNGIGKSTLLKTIVGKLNKLQGNIHFGHQVNVGYFAQDQLDTFDPNLNIIENIQKQCPQISEKRIRTILGHFLFNGDDAYKKLKVLSGGEKSRVGLATLLANSFNFLILDEPTNHLDMSSIEMLANALDEFEGTVLFVSHDRDFINEFCTHIFVMTQSGKHGLFEGHLDDYQRLAKIQGFENIFENPFTSNEKVAKNKSKERDEFEKTKLEKTENQKIQKEIQKIEKDIEAFQTQILKKESELNECYLNAEKDSASKTKNLILEIKILKNSVRELEEKWVLFNSSDSTKQIFTE